MKSPRGLCGIICLVACLASTTFSCVALRFGLELGAHPSTKALARHYLDAVMQHDVERAVELALAGCQQCVRQEAQKDVDRFGGAEIRRLTIKVQSGTGSDQEIEFALITFEYRKDGQSTWQPGEMRITTGNDPPGPRHLYCGG